MSWLTVSSEAVGTGGLGRGWAMRGASGGIPCFFTCLVYGMLAHGGSQDRTDLKRQEHQGLLRLTNWLRKHEAALYGVFNPA